MRLEALGECFLLVSFCDLCTGLSYHVFSCKGAISSWIVFSHIC